MVSSHLMFIAKSRCRSTENKGTTNFGHSVRGILTYVWHFGNSYPVPTKLLWTQLKLFEKCRLLNRPASLCHYGDCRSCSFALRGICGSPFPCNEQFLSSHIGLVCCKFWCRLIRLLGWGSLVSCNAVPSRLWLSRLGCGRSDTDGGTDWLEKGLVNDQMKWCEFCGRLE